MALCSLQCFDTDGIGWVSGRKDIQIIKKPIQLTQRFSSGIGGGGPEGKRFTSTNGR